MTYRILVVDDEEDIRQLASLILRNAGYAVAEAADGPNALALLAAGGIDLVLLDIMIPGMTGWEVCARIKADPILRRIPVVIFTVRTLARDRQEYESTRPEGYINKPFEPAALLREVANLLAVPRPDQPAEASADLAR